MGMAFSLTEKLAMTGAFLALVAMGVGTEAEPGVVVTQPAAVAELRPTEPVLEQAQAQAPTTSSTRGWSLFRDGAAEAAAADERGSVGVEKAPEPPPRAY